MRTTTGGSVRCRPSDRDADEGGVRRAPLRVGDPRGRRDRGPHAGRATGGGSGLRGRGPDDLRPRRDHLARRAARGDGEVNGVRVRRIRSEAGRDEGFHPLWAQCMEDPAHAGQDDMERWVDLQGPRSPALLDAVAASDADVIVFYPYLYYPSVRGLPLVRERADHASGRARGACAAPADLRRPVQPVPGFVFHTRSERTLVTDRFHVGATPQVLVGPRRRGGRAVTARARRGGEEGCGSVRVGDVPYVCASGEWTTRRAPACCGGTSVPTRSATPDRSSLVSWVRSWTRRSRPHDIVVTGMIDDETKWAFAARRAGLVMPSPYEAFASP